MKRAARRSARVAWPMAAAAPAWPMAAWIQLGTRTFEMLVASGQVIAMRLARMAAAGPQPGARDRKEFARMGSEKLQAASQSALAVGALWPFIGWQLWARIAHAALRPVHRTATANARRLARRRAAR